MVNAVGRGLGKALEMTTAEGVRTEDTG
jgi:hypothetical protein